MKKETLKEMASRCRLMARTADKFTKIRLLELASKYEAQLERQSPLVKSAYRRDSSGEPVRGTAKLT